MENNKYFDLNINKILDSWETSDAVREIISNASDESKITQTKTPLIYKQNEKWIVQDFGRGITIPNFSQNESEEKKQHANVIGRFGVGLKDSIAVLFRKKNKFTIITKEIESWPVLRNKNNFNEKTIHMVIQDSNQNIQGTKFIFENLDDEDMKKAKSNFLIFENSKVLFENRFGQIILSKENSKSAIYVQGMKVSLDDDYTFSYNILNINKKLYSKMNRERKSLGRNAYSDSIEKIITKEIPIELINMFSDDENSGEMTKKNIRKIVYQAMNRNGQHVFMTECDYENLDNGQKEAIRALGKRIKRIKNLDNDLTSDLFGLDNAMTEYNENFKYEEVPISKLSKLEKNNLLHLKKILEHLDKTKQIVIMKKNNTLNEDLNGFWSPNESNKLYIVKKVLSKTTESLLTLIHEYAHSMCGNSDATRSFEQDLESAWYEYSNLDEL